MKMVEFAHENRRSNFEPHNLVKAATALDVGRHVWLINPPGDYLYPDKHCSIKFSGLLKKREKKRRMCMLGATSVR